MIGVNMNIIFRITLFIFTLFFINSASQLTAQETNSLKDCNIITPLYSHSRFLEPEGKALTVLRSAICDRVRKNSWSMDKANRVLKNYIFYYFKCNRSKLDISEKNRLETEFNKLKYNELSKELPKSLIFAEEGFCRSVYDSTKWPFVDSEHLKKRIQWLENEYFCLLSYHAANPGSLIEKVLDPNLPSDERIRAKADELCGKLKRGQISKFDAYYDFHVELRRWMKDSGPEEIKRYGKAIKDPLKNIWNLIIKNF